MKKTKKGIAVLLLVAVLFNMSITSVFAAETSEPKVYTKETKTLTLNENFSANGCDGAIYAHDDANLTINGTGKVHGELCGEEHDPENNPGELCGYAMAVWAKNNTKITINGGTYTNDEDTVSNDKTHVDLIYASNGSEITITGGTFKSSTPKWTLNCKDEKNTAEEVVLPSTITVTGGTFYQFDPSKADVGEGEVIVPEGYRVVKNGDWYTVVKTVYENEKNTINLEGELSANGCDGVIYAHDDANLTINGTGKVHGELCGEEHDPENNPGELCGYAMAVWAKNNTKITINGGTYTNDEDTVSNDKTHVDLIYASNGSEITITGGTFKSSTPKWTLNCKDEKNTAEEVVLPSTITVTGGTFYQFDPSKADVGEGEVIVPDGYRVAKNGDWYTVYKENTITIQEVEGGTVSATLAKAIVGETVGLTIKANDGYEIDNVTVIDSNGNAVTVTNNEFVMPDSAVTVTAEFTKIPEPEPTPEVGGEIDFIVSEDKTENNNIGVVESEKVEETLDASLKADTKLNEKVEEAKKNGETVTVEIKMEALDKNNVKEEVKQQILQTVAANQTVHQYFDISVLVRTSDKELGKLTELTEKMKFSMEISKDLIKEGRKFYIINLHGDEVNRIEATLSGTKLEFETDKFSTFALAYEDVKTNDNAPAEQQPETGEKDDTPKTGAINIPGYVWVSIAGMALIGILTTKKHSKHSK